MKIAIFTDTFFPQVNGIVTHILQITERLLDNGHEIIIFAPKDVKRPKPPFSKKVQIYYLPSIPFTPYEGYRFAAPFLPRVNTIIKAFEPDIIHFHTPYSVGVSGIMLAKLYRIPLIGTFHTYFMEPEYLRIFGLHKVKLDTNQVVNKIVWQFSNIFYNRANLVLVPTQFTKKDLIQNGLTTKIEVMSNGIDIEAITKSMHTRFKTNLQLPEKYFMYVGRISEEKSLDIVLKAFALFSLKNPPVSLVIVGDGPTKDALKKLIRNLKIGKKVILLGSIPHAELIQSAMYKKALAFVTASKSETQGIALLEAAAFKLPLIGVKARGVSEIIGKNGLLCEPDNIEQLAQAMTDISANPLLRQKYSDEAFKMATHHSILKTVEHLERIYRRML